MQVQNNPSAFRVWRYYNYNLKEVRRSMKKQSSGKRVAMASDDAAGLAMSERLRAQYRNSAAAVSNMENKINHLQTADAWLQKIQDILGRMSEMAISANDGTRSQIARSNLQSEFEQMQQEIQNITSGTSASGRFNGLYLFRGGSGVAVMTGDGIETGYGNVRLQIGPDSNQVFDETTIDLQTNGAGTIGSYVDYEYGSVNMTLLGSTHHQVNWGSVISPGNVRIENQTGAQGAVAKVNLAIDYISSMRAIVGSEMQRMDYTIGGLKNYSQDMLDVETRLTSVDVARETMVFAKHRMLADVDNAILAQANTLTRGVVNLLT